jgi:hypothetical protein
MTAISRGHHHDVLTLDADRPSSPTVPIMIACIGIAGLVSTSTAARTGAATTTGRAS